MDRKELKEIVEAVIRDKVLRSTDIPSIDLYLDQILTLVEDKAGIGSTQNSLTKTMINNYSKDGLIKPVKGKKYTKEHIVQMMIIYYMKGVLSISDIKRIFDGIYADESFGGDELINCYDRFLDIKKNEKELCKSIIEELNTEAGSSTSKNGELLIMLMSVVSMSECLKSCALEVISREFPEKDKPQKPEKVKEKKSKKSEDKVDASSDKK